MAPPVSTRPAIAWEWSGAFFGLLCALPAAAVVGADISKGLAFGVGVIPAVVVGVSPSRRQRPTLILVGITAGLAMFVGAVLSHVPWLAVAGLFLMAVGAVELAQRRRIGGLVLTLALPLVGVGLSYSEVGQAAALALILAAGSIYACIVSMAWPESEPPEAPARAPGPTLGYGVRLGLAAATAAAIGFALDLEHVGWACAAALLVMRPVAEMQRLRSAGRITSVVVGALAGGLFARYTTSPLLYAIALVIVITIAAATRTSRWYITPAFTTFIVLSLLVSPDPNEAATRFNERVIETILGVGIAYAYGLALPRLRGARPAAS